MFSSNLTVTFISCDGLVTLPPGGTYFFHHQMESMRECDHMPLGEYALPTIYHKQYIVHPREQWYIKSVVYEIPCGSYNNEQKKIGLEVELEKQYT